MISMGSTLTNSVGIKPHDVNAERGLLACIGKNSDSMIDAIERGMNSDWFMDPICIQIADQMLKNEREGLEVDDITISLSMPNESRTDAFEVFDAVETSAHFRMFLDKVEGLWLKRKTIDACNATLEMAYDRGSQPLDVIENGGMAFSKLSLKDNRKLTTGKEVMAKAWENILARQSEDGISGVASGISGLDKLTYGWHKGDVVTIAARTSVGKTAFSCQLALEALRSGKIVQFFSLEMQNESVMERMLANQSGVPIRVMVDKCMTEGQRDAVENAKSFFQHSNLYMEDDGNMSVATIRAKARKLARKGLDMIVVDYAQLIRPEDPRASREQQVAMISKGIKMLAKELGIPIIMLAQLSRNADQQDTCPKLSDLRESGSLEQDADLVLMLWRKATSKDEYHHVVTVAKQRNGRLGPVNLEFKASVQQFKERLENRLS